MSLAARAVDEVGEFLRVALLWLLLGPAFGPATVAASALPVPASGGRLVAALLTVGGVAVLRYYDPSWDLLRAFVVGAATGIVFVALYVLSGTGDAVAAGGSWVAFGGVVASWLAALGVGVALAHPRTCLRLRRAVAVE